MKRTFWNKNKTTVLPAWSYADTALAGRRVCRSVYIVNPSVCSSQDGVLLKRMDGSNFLTYTSFVLSHNAS